MYDEALRIIERQKPPVIAAPEAILRRPLQRRFVPNNSKNWPTQRKLNPVKGIDLEPEPILYWDIDVPTVVWYHWPDVPSKIVDTVRQLSRHTWSVGKGEDFAVLDALAEPPPSDLTSWRETAAPGDSGPSLESPERGCLDVCDAAFWRSANDAPLPISGVRSVRYVSNGDPEARVPLGP